MCPCQNPPLVGRPLGVDLPPEQTKLPPTWVLVLGGGFALFLVYGLFFAKGTGRTYVRRGSATETSYGIGDFTYREREENWV